MWIGPFQFGRRIIAAHRAPAIVLAENEKVAIATPHFAVLAVRQVHRGVDQVIRCGARIQLTQTHSAGRFDMRVFVTPRVQMAFAQAVAVIAMR
jgi:hypothetical protein